ncbi:MAG: hypothetical protein JSU80_10420 [Deltaproteobacteria bacterium]|nr:MAG: hypothetical protein JSU80_10420 [Deltaproteobacteria bacterium]
MINVKLAMILTGVGDHIRPNIFSRMELLADHDMETPRSFAEKLPYRFNLFIPVAAENLFKPEMGGRNLQFYFRKIHQQGIVRSGYVLGLLENEHHRPYNYKGYKAYH